MPEVSMDTKVIDAFIERLAAMPDEKDRARMLAKVKMRAVDLAPGEAFKPDVRSLRDYLATPIPLPPSLVWPTIAVRGEITTTLGRAGKGKTTMNLNRIFAWGAGRPLFPGWTDKDGNEYLKPEKALRTLIAENEGNAGMFHSKMGQMLNQSTLNKAEKELCLDNLFVHGDGGYSGLKLDKPEGVKKLRAAVEACKPDIVFIEPFRSLWSGEENSSTDMNIVIDNIISLATDYGVAVILSHHERKSGVGEDGEKMSAGRGSTVLEGAVAVMENFQSVKDDEFRELSWSKARYLPPPPLARMQYNPDTGWYDWIQQSQIEETVLLVLRDDAGDEPINMTAIAEATGETKRKLTPILTSLVSSGKVKKMPSISSQHGSTGPRFRLASQDNAEFGGLSI
jgi:hypothetical protein